MVLMLSDYQAYFLYAIQMKISIDLDHTIIDYSGSAQYLSRKYLNRECEYSSLRELVLEDLGESGWRVMQEHLYLTTQALHQLFPYVYELFRSFPRKITINSVRSNLFYSTNIKYLEPSKSILREKGWLIEDKFLGNDCFFYEREELKVKHIVETGYDVHFDDRESVLEGLKGSGVRGVLFDADSDGLQSEFEKTNDPHSFLRSNGFNQ